MVNAVNEWPKLAISLNRKDLLEDERFQGGGLLNNMEELRSELNKEFSSRSLEEVNIALRESGATFGVISKAEDIKEDKQFHETKTLVELNHEGMPGVFTINSPFNIKDENKKDPYRAPRIGEHSKEILEEIGINKEQQIDLKEKGTIYWE